VIERARTDNGQGRDGTMMRVSMLRVLVVWIVLLAAGPVAASCRADTVDLRGAFGQVRFTVEVADTDETLARGLMFRETLPRMSGMLFIYETPRRAMFWMENTLIPLDMLFFDNSGRLTHVHHQARPLDRTTIDGGEGVRFVLEINGGMARQLGIRPGADLRHPAVPADLAVWPCD